MATQLNWPAPQVGRGGRRNGAGRKKGTTKAKINADRRRAALTGELPHQFLLRIMRGEVINGEKPSIQLRVDCAKAAAPYYAPKLSAVQVVENLSDDDLDFIIESAAAEAGVSFGTGGEGEEGKDT